MSHLMDSAGVAGLLSSISQHGALQTLEDANIFGTLENDGKNLKNKRSVSALVQPGDKGLQDWTAPKFATRYVDCFLKSDYWANCGLFFIFTRFF